MVGALRTEGHTASHFCVWPNFTLKRLNLEKLVLEEHLVLFYGFPDAHILAVESGHSPLLTPLHLLLGLGLVI